MCLILILCKYFNGPSVDFLLTGVLNVNFRTPATHKMAPWVRKAFIDFLPKYLFIERPPPQPTTDEPPGVNNAEINAGFNIVFPETLEAELTTELF